MRDDETGAAEGWQWSYIYTNGEEDREYYPNKTLSMRSLQHWQGALLTAAI